jgi:hypothetical protein
MQEKEHDMPIEHEFGLSDQSYGLSETAYHLSGEEDIVDSGPADLSDIDIEQEAADEISTVLTGFKERATKEHQRFMDAVDSEHWLCLCFQTREQKEEFLRKTRLGELGDKYLDGMLVAETLGIALTTPVPPMPSYRIDRRLAELSLDE